MEIESCILKTPWPARGSHHELLGEDLASELEGNATTLASRAQLRGAVGVVVFLQGRATGPPDLLELGRQLTLVHAPGQHADALRGHFVEATLDGQLRRLGAQRQHLDEVAHLRVAEDLMPGPVNVLGLLSR